MKQPARSLQSVLLSAFLLLMTSCQSVSKSGNQTPVQTEYSGAQSESADSRTDSKSQNLEGSSKRAENRTESDGSIDHNSESVASFIPESERHLANGAWHEAVSISQLDGFRKIRLNIPQKIQETGWWCAPACLQMALEYWHLNFSQEELADRLCTSQVTGTEYEDLAREASLLIFGRQPELAAEPGYRAEILKSNDERKELRQQFEQRAIQDLMAGDPVFISINMKQAYGETPDIVHQVILYGADLDADEQAVNFYYLDPYEKQQHEVHEGRKVFSADGLWKAMIDNPEPGYVW